LLKRSSHRNPFLTYRSRTLRRSSISVNFWPKHTKDRIGLYGTRQNRPGRTAGDSVCLPGATDRAPFGAPGFAQASQCLGGAKLAALVDSSAGEFHQSRRCFAGGRDRLEPRFSALRLSGGGVVGGATVGWTGVLAAR